MSDLNLTKEEREIVEAMARDRHGTVSRLAFYASVLIPVLLFGGYGCVQRDFVAVAVALLGLLIFTGWRISGEFSRMSPYKSLCRKITEHERRSSNKS